MWSKLRRIAPGVVITVLCAGLPVAAVTAGAIVAAAPAGATVVAPPSGGTIALNTRYDGNLESPGEEDIYTFTLAATTRVFGQVHSASCSCRDWILRSSTGAIIWDRSMYVGSFSDYALTPATYTLTVRASANLANGGDPVGAYAFTLWSMTSTFRGLITAPAPGQPAVTQPGTLKNPGDEDTYWVSVPTATIVSFEVTKPRAYMALRDGKNRVVFDRSMSSVGGIALPADVYTLAVYPNGNFAAQTGDYEFKLWAPAIDTSASVPQAISATVQTVSGTFDTPGAVRSHSFAGTAGTKIQLRPVCNGPTYALRLRGTALTLRLPCNVTHVITLPYTGTYDLIALQPWTRFITSNYSFTIATSTATPTIAFRTMKTDSGGKPLAWTLPAPTAAAPVTVPIAPTSVVDQTLATAANGAGNISVGGEQDAYTFTGSAGQQIYLTPTTKNSALYWELLRSNGDRVVLTNSIQFYDYPVNADRPWFVLPATDTYTLVVYGTNATNTGSYAFSIYSMAAPIPAAATSLNDATTKVFPNDGVTKVSVNKDHVTRAKPTVVGDQPQDSQITGVGEIKNPGETDVYTFDAKAGQQIWFSSVTGSSAGMKWEVRRPDAALLLSGNLSNNAGLYTLPMAGKYVISAFGSGLATGTYNFHLYSVPPFAATPPDLGKVGSTSITRSGTIAVRGTQNVYTFTADAGQAIYIDRTTTTNIGLLIEVRGPDGVVLLTGTFIGDPGLVKLPRSGKYWVRVGSGDGISDYTTGDYGFILTLPAIQKFNVTLSGTLAISKDVPATGAGNIDVAGAKDVYNFTAPAGRQIVIAKPATTTTQLAGTWRLTDGGGLWMADGDLSATSPVITLPRTGEYTLTVAPTTFNVGTYALNITTQATTGSPLSNADVASVPLVDSVAGANPTPTHGVIDSVGGEDSWLIDAQAGDTMYLDLRSQCSQAWFNIITDRAMHWAMRDPQGNIMLESNFAHCLVGPVVAPSSGTYIVRVGHALFPQSYTFNVWRVANQADSIRVANPGGPATITRIDPPQSPAGGTATINLYGRNVAQPIAVHVRKSGVELPSELAAAHAPNTSVETDVAQVQLNLAAASTGTYTISVDFAGAPTMNVSPTFTVQAAIAPAVTIAVEGPPDGLRINQQNFIFIRATNAGGADYWDLPLTADVPCNVSAALVLDPTASDLRTRAPAQVMKDGTCKIYAELPMVPPHSSIAVQIEMIPKATGSGPVTVSTMAGDHTTPDSATAPTSRIVQSLLDLGTAATGTTPLMMRSGALRRAMTPAEIYVLIHLVKDLWEGAKQLGEAGKKVWEWVQEAKELSEQLFQAAEWAEAHGLASLAATLLSLAAWLDSLSLLDVLLLLEPLMGLLLALLLVTLALLYVVGVTPETLEGPPGSGPDHTLSPGERVSYAVHFWNDEHASGAAQKVDVHLPLDDALDPSTLKIDALSVGGVDAVLKGDGADTSGEVTVPFKGGTQVNVHSSFDAETREFSAFFDGPDDRANKFTPSPYGIFLPPLAKGSHEGEGWVRFSVNVRSDAPAKAAVRERASVTFDSHAQGMPSFTNTWANQVDLLPAVALGGATATRSGMRPAVETPEKAARIAKQHRTVKAPAPAAMNPAHAATPAPSEPRRAHGWDWLLVLLAFVTAAAATGSRLVRRRRRLMPQPA